MTQISIIMLLHTVLQHEFWAEITKIEIEQNQLLKQWFKEEMDMPSAKDLLWGSGHWLSLRRKLGFLQRQSELICTGTSCRPEKHTMYPSDFTNIYRGRNLLRSIVIKHVPLNCKKAKGCTHFIENKLRYHSSWSLLVYYWCLSRFVRLGLSQNTSCMAV